MPDRRFTPDKWIRLSAFYFTDPRIMRVGLEAEAIYVRGLAFARSQRSDGHVSTEQIALIVVGVKSHVRAIERLVDEGLWERCDDGFRVPKDKWERWQNTEGEIDARRTADRERKAAWRDARREQDTDPDERY